MVLYYIFDAIGNLLGEDRPPEDLGDPIEFTPGICVDAGAFWLQTFKQLVIPPCARYSDLKRGCPSKCGEVTMKSCRRCDCRKMGLRC